MQNTDILITTLESITDQLAVLLPKLIIALVIWYAGRYAIGLAVNFVLNIDGKKAKVKGSAITKAAAATEFGGKIVLILVILDFLGIGRTIIASFTQGITFAMAIAIGLSFGKALEPDAKNIVENFRKVFKG